MSLARRMANLFRQSRVDREIAAELDAHIEMRTADNVAAGMSAEEARRDAVLRFGNLMSTRERVAAADAALTIESVVRDVRFALRQMRRSPGFAATAVIILALGIGAGTAIFSVVDPILFEPLPYPHPGKILTVWNSYKSQRGETSFGTFREIEARSRSFESLATFEPWQPVMTGKARAERPNGQSVTAAYFRVLGVAPALGRDFTAGDQLFNAPKVVILSDRFWRTHTAADPAVVGSTIKLNDDIYTVIAVMPRGFENVLEPSAELWRPLRYSPADLASMNWDAWGFNLRMAGRTGPGVSIDDAREELNRIAHHPESAYPRPRWASLSEGLFVDSLQDAVVGAARPALLAILGAVTLLLAIACVNVANLLLARGAQRRGEFAMRATLGAARSRLIRQALTESVLVALLGGVLGLAVAAAGIRLLLLLSPPGLPRLDAIGLNAPVFLFCFGLSAAIGLIAGLLPALQTQHGNLQPAMLLNSRMTAGCRQGARRALVVGEIALAMLLLVGAGLLMRSMARLLAIDPGFDASHVLTLAVETAGHKFDDLPSAPGTGSAARQRFFRLALDQARAVPGVKEAAFASILPLGGDADSVTTYGSHFENDDPNSGRNVFRYAVSPGYCQAMGIPLLRGRFLDERDSATAPQAALISESLARRQYPGQNPIGKRLHLGPMDRPWYTVVGVVGNVRQASLELNQSFAVYITEQQSWFADDTMSFVLRARGDAASLAPAAQEAIWRVDKDQPIVRVATMKELLDVSVAQRRFVLILFQAFSLVALLLAATGIYGVLAGSVAARTREIGVRTALGATRAQIRTLIVGQGLRLTFFGLAIGLTVAAIASGAIASMLYGVSRLDPIAYAGVSGLLLLVSLAACLVPARRAANIDPMQALRSE